MTAHKDEVSHLHDEIRHLKAENKQLKAHLEKSGGHNEELDRFHKMEAEKKWRESRGLPT